MLHSLYNFALSIGFSTSTTTLNNKRKRHKLTTYGSDGDEVRFTDHNFTQCDKNSVHLIELSPNIYHTPQNKTFEVLCSKRRLLQALVMKIGFIYLSIEKKSACVIYFYYMTPNLT